MIFYKNYLNKTIFLGDSSRWENKNWGIIMGIIKKGIIYFWHFLNIDFCLILKNKFYLVHFNLIAAECFSDRVVCIYIEST